MYCIAVLIIVEMMTYESNFSPGLIAWYFFFKKKFFEISKNHKTNFAVELPLCLDFLDLMVFSFLTKKEKKR